MNSAKSTIFISYSHKDAKFANQIKSQLQRQGFKIWIDHNLLADEAWRSQIGRGLEISEVMILIWSPEAKASDEVSREWHTFLELKKPIILVIHKSAPFDGEAYPFWREQRISFEQDGFAIAFGKLIDALNKHNKSRKPALTNELEQNNQKTRTVAKLLHRTTPKIFVVIVSLIVLSCIAIVYVLSITSETVPLFEFVYEDVNTIRYLPIAQNSPWNHLLVTYQENVRHPVWSPNGDYVAFLSTERLGEFEQHRIHVIDINREIPSGNGSVVYGTELPISCLRWRTNQELIFTSPVEGGIEIFQLTLSLLSESMGLIRLVSVIGGVFESCPTVRDNGFIYSANRDGDAELYLYNQISGQEMQLTRNDVDDLMPEIGGKRPTMIFYQTTQNPDVYSVIRMSIMGITFDRPDLPTNWESDYISVLFETRRLSRLSWGEGGYSFAFGYESPNQSLGGLAVYCLASCPPVGSGPVLVTNITFDGTNPSWRPSPR